MKFTSYFSFVMLAVMAANVQAAKPKETIAAFDAQLKKLGEAKLDGVEIAGDKMVPVIFFGSRKINNSYFIVDDIKKATGATATVFVKHGDEFVRVSTNVLTKEGKRGIGTQLARARAYDAIIKGEHFCGEVDVLGTQFDACYSPIKDKSAKVIGVTYIGFPK